MSFLRKGLLSLLTVFMFTIVIGHPNSASAAPSGHSIIETGKKFLGARYSYGGSTPSGFDCSGFTSYTFKQHGITLPRSSASMYNIGKSVNKSDLQAGDLVFFNTSGSKISHVGIYVGDNKFIHSAGKGVVITSLDDPYYWKSKYVGAKRII